MQIIYVLEQVRREKECINLILMLCGLGKLVLLVCTCLKTPPDRS